MTWGEILKPHDWTLVVEYGTYGVWRRPGKKWGISAPTGYNGSDLLYGFSSNAHRFEPQRGYSKFSAYALLNHKGDFKKAAAVLAAEWYVNSPDKAEGLDIFGYGVEWVFSGNRRRGAQPEMKRKLPIVISMAELAAQKMPPMDDLKYWGQLTCLSPPDSEILVGLSEAKLQALAHSALAPAEQVRLNDLLARNADGVLPEADQTELDRLLHHVD